MALAAATLLFVPETIAQRTPLSLRLQGLGIPKTGRPEFLAAFAAFALLGLFTALAPSFLGQVLHERNHAVDGAVVFALYASSTATQLLVARFGTRRVVLAGLATLLVALALVVAGLSAASMALSMAGIRRAAPPAEARPAGAVTVGGAIIASLSVLAVA